jgi:hypothetical protein
MEYLTIQNYLAAQATVLIVGVIFLFWKRPNQPFKLNMRNTKPQSKNAPALTLVRPTVERTPVTPSASRGTSAARNLSLSLNVHFMHNGHSFDAYEVLGLPAGASLERVHAAFESSARSSDESSRAFLESAVRAIEIHIKRH